jgi:hypothetical protein
MFTLTGYFRAFANSGGGPDNAIVQILSETGMFGVAAFGLAASGLIIAVRRNSNQWTPFALASMTFVAASALTNDSVHVPYLLVVALLCAALAGPVNPIQVIRRTKTPAAKTRWLGIWLGTVFVMMVVAADSFALALRERGVEDANGGNTVHAIELLQIATTLDPSNALLQRDLGILMLESGDAAGAYDRLRTAVSMSPADTMAMRAAALAAETLGQADASALAGRAADLRPLDPVNLAFFALVAKQSGSHAEANGALADLLVNEPYIAAAPSWQANFPVGRDLENLLSRAVEKLGSRSADPRSSAERNWLLAETGSQTDVTDPGVQAIASLLQCDVDGAERAVAESRAIRNPEVWDIVAQVMVPRALGDESTAAKAAIRGALLYTPVGGLAQGEVGPGSPVSEAGEDWRIYRYIGASVPQGDTPGLPTFAEAMNRWLTDPVDSARLGAPGSSLASCNLGSP